VYGIAMKKIIEKMEMLWTWLPAQLSVSRRIYLPLGIIVIIWILSKNF